MKGYTARIKDRVELKAKIENDCKYQKLIDVKDSGGIRFVFEGKEKAKFAMEEARRYLGFQSDRQNFTVLSLERIVNLQTPDHGIYDGIHIVVKFESFCIEIQGHTQLEDIVYPLTHYYHDLQYNESMAADMKQMLVYFIEKAAFVDKGVAILQRNNGIMNEGSLKEFQALIEKAKLPTTSSRAADVTLSYLYPTIDQSTSIAHDFLQLNTSRWLRHSSINNRITQTGAMSGVDSFNFHSYSGSAFEYPGSINSGPYITIPGGVSSNDNTRSNQNTVGSNTANSTPKDQK